MKIFDKKLLFKVSPPLARIWETYTYCTMHNLPNVQKNSKSFRQLDSLTTIQNSLDARIGPSLCYYSFSFIIRLKCFEVFLDGLESSQHRVFWCRSSREGSRQEVEAN